MNAATRWDVGVTEGDIEEFLTRIKRGAPFRTQETPCVLYAGTKQAGTEGDSKPLGIRRIQTAWERAAIPFVKETQQ